jgi:hypothetical protein
VVIYRYDSGVVSTVQPGGNTLIRQPDGYTASVSPAGPDGQVHVVEQDPNGLQLTEYDSALDQNGWPEAPPEPASEGHGPSSTSLLAGGGGAAALATGAAAAFRARKGKDASAQLGSEG